MNKKAAQDLTVDSFQLYSLDRCIKCLAKLNLGQKTFCRVKLTKKKAATLPGEAGMEPS